MGRMLTIMGHIITIMGRMLTIVGLKFSFIESIMQFCLSNMKKPSFKIMAYAENKRTPLEITAVVKDKIAYLGIKGSIYRWNTASSVDIEAAIKGFKKDGITKAELYINTPGGDCFEANEIVNLVKDNFTDVTVKVGAVAASAGTYFLTQWHSTAKRNSQFMIHKPMGNPSGNEDEIAAGLKLIQNMTQDYKSAYASKMGITEQEIENLWMKGDYWMTAQEALKKGLIDAIEPADEPINAESRLQLVACGAPNIPKIENNQNKNKTMELPVLAVMIGLPSDATQAQVNAKLAELKTKATQSDALVQAAADKAKVDMAAKKKTVLDAAEVAKKITAKQRPHLEAMELEALEAFLKDAPSIKAISDIFEPGTKGENEGRDKWTYADYQEKDPKAFEALDESAQNKLIEAHYKND